MIGSRKQQIRISQLWMYPLKSASPIAVSTAVLDKWGLKYDRIFMLVEEDKKEDGKFKSMSQKRYPVMAKLHQTLNAEEVEAATMLRVVNSNTGDSTELPLLPDTSNLPILTASMPFYPTAVSVYDMGEKYATFFSEFMRRPCRLVYRDPHRVVYGPRPDTGSFLEDSLLLPFWQRTHLTALTDAVPLHIITSESLANLSQLHGGDQPIPPERFRPNIMLAGGKPWDEETWKLLDVVDVGKIAVTARCPRCGVPDVDPETGKRDAIVRPTVPLKAFRRSDPSVEWGGRAMFGMWAVNLVVDKPLSVGDEVRVVSRGYHELRYP